MLLIIWLYLIFYLSNQSGAISSYESNSIIEQILIFLKVDRNCYELIHNIVREFMHFFEYFILGFIIYINLIEYKVKDIYLITILTSFIYSVSDEIHQVFVPGRTFEYLDISLDLFGVILSILTIHLIKYILNKKKVV